MKHKDFLKSLLMSFFVVVTLINIAIAIVGLLFDQDRYFGYEAYFLPLIYGSLSMIPSAILYSSKELTLRQMFFRKLLQILLIELLLLSFVYLNGIREARQLLPLAISILIVALSVLGILWLLDNKSARELNKELERYQKSNQY